MQAWVLEWLPLSSPLRLSRDQVRMLQLGNVVGDGASGVSKGWLRDGEGVDFYWRQRRR